MIQLDALSRQLDYIPEQDNNNMDRIMLPENMFVNLMDLNLQDRIANTVKNALELLLENGPNSLRHSTISTHTPKVGCPENNYSSEWVANLGSN